jgi:hypothetical protein
LRRFSIAAFVFELFPFCPNILWKCSNSFPCTPWKHGGRLR